MPQKLGEALLAGNARHIDGSKPARHRIQDREKKESGEGRAAQAGSGASRVKLGKLAFVQSKDDLVLCCLRFEVIVSVALAFDRLALLIGVFLL